MAEKPFSMYADSVPCVRVNEKRSGAFAGGYLGKRN